jgi:translation initiation factor IF-3
MGKNKNKPKVIKVTYNTQENDLKHKRNSIIKFLNKGLDVKIQMQIRGRAVNVYTEPLEKLKEMFSQFRFTNAWNKGDNYYLFIQNNSKNG